MAQIDDGTGAAPMGGGSGAGGGNDVELTFGDVEKIGQDTAALSGDAEAAKARLADARGHGAAFGSYPPAQALQAHHQAVVNVFEDTLAAITADLDNFGTTIVQAAHAYEQTDEDARASLAAVAAQLDPQGLTDRHTDARNQQGEKLDDVTSDDLNDFAGDHPDLPESVTNDMNEFTGNGHPDAVPGSGFHDGDSR
jgi:hypothetical protein